MRCKSCGTEDSTHFDDDRAEYCVSCEETNREMEDEANREIADEENGFDPGEESE